MAKPVLVRTNSASAVRDLLEADQVGELDRVDPVGAGGEDEQGPDVAVEGMGPEDQGVGDLGHVDPERVGGGAGGAGGVGQDPDAAPDTVLAQRCDDPHDRRVRPARCRQGWGAWSNGSQPVLRTGSRGG